MDFSRLETSSKIGDGWVYPPAQATNSGWLEVDADAGHRIYWEEYGAADGEPVMFLHGGPGGACAPDMARFFDLKRYRVILFDQRGCGKSEPNVAAAGPAAALRNNTTADLIGDIEALRDALAITGKMHVFGGSWGSTLAMAYAIEFPRHCASLVLRGIFLGAAEDLLYLYQGNAATWHEAPHALTAPGAYISYPDEWGELLSVLTVEERADVMASYKAIFDRVPATEAEREKQLHAALTWSLWEGVISNMIPEDGGAGKFGDADFALCFAQIEAHYFANNLFIEPGHLLGGAATLASIPVHIVHGRFDQVCPLTQASRLVDALRGAGAEPATYVITNAGHSAMERENALALTAIMDGLPRIAE